ncbi:unnamed protein product [Caenorhabditis nigoni]
MEVIGNENRGPIANEVRLFGYGVFGSTDSNECSSNFFDGSGYIRIFGDLLETFPRHLEPVPISPPSSDADLPEKDLREEHDLREEDHHQEEAWKSSAKSKPIQIPKNPRPEWPNTRGLPVAAAQLGLEVVAVYTDEKEKIGGSTEASGSGVKQVKFDPDMSPIGEAYRYTLLKQWHH